MRLFLCVDSSDSFVLLDPKRIDPDCWIAPDRRYYIGGPAQPPALIVCLNNLQLPHLVGQVVDVTIGEDIALSAFCGDYAGQPAQYWVGKRRLKITIRACVSTRYDNGTLNDEIRRWRP